MEDGRGTEHAAVRPMTRMLKYAAAREELSRIGAGRHDRSGLPARLAWRAAWESTGKDVWEGT